MSMNLPRTCVPVPKIENDCYDWWKRHESKLAWSRVHQAKVVFFGDSITHFWTEEDGINYGQGHWNELFADKPVLNLGYGFDRIQNVLWRIDHGELDGQSPVLFVVCIGTNQYSITPNYSGDTPEDTAEGICFLTKKLHALFPNAQLEIMTLFPRGGKMNEINATNDLLHQMIPGLPNTELLDISSQYLKTDGTPDPIFFQPDFCHLSRKGYEIWAKAILPVINKYL